MLVQSIVLGLIGVFVMLDSRLLGRLNFERPLIVGTLVGCRPCRYDIRSSYRNSFCNFIWFKCRDSFDNRYSDRNLRPIVRNSDANGSSQFDSPSRCID